MTCRSTLLTVALLLPGTWGQCPPGPVQGQGAGWTFTEIDTYVSPPGPGMMALEVELGNTVTGTPEWQGPDRQNPRAASSFRLRANAPKGAWVTLLFRTYINGTSQLAANLKAAYPWLDKRNPVPAAQLYPGWAGQPDVNVDGPLFWMMMFNSIVDPVTGTLNGNACRDWYVPVLADGEPDEHNYRMWDARPLGWTADQSGYGIGPVMSGIWSGTLWDQGPTGDPEVLYSEALVRLACMLQAPDAATATCFLDSEDFWSAISEEMFVDIQAVAAISTDPNRSPPGLTDLDAPGIEGLPGFLPGGMFSNPLTLAVAIAAPATNGGGPGGGLPSNAVRGQIANFYLRGAVPSSYLHFLGGATPIRLHWAGNLLNPMRFRLMIPLWAQPGALGMTNPQVFSAVTIGSITVQNSGTGGPGGP